MKSPKKNGIGEVVTDYGRRVMRIFKKGLLQRSLFDFYGDIKADSVKIKESSSVPSTPVDGDGGVVYIKSADGKLYFKSNEVSEVELSSSGATLTTEQVQDIVGAMFSSNTETNITVTYEDSDGTIDLVATDTNTQLTTEEVQDIVGAMFTSNTETRISATYEDSDGTIDLVVDDMTADTNTNVGNADMTLSGTRNINTSDNTFQIKNGSTVYLEFDDSGITTLTASSDLDIGAHEIRASKFQSDVTTGTAPLTVASTTAVANLQAATATTLHTARNIGGVSFNGSANIDLPGVNSAGNQNTSGNAATATSLTTGDKAITGTLTVTDGAENIVLNSTASNGNPLLTFKQDSTRRAFIQLADNNAGFENHMRIASEYGPVSIAAASTSGSDTDTVYLMVEPTGIFKFGAADADAVLTTDGNMTFRIDSDNDETGQKFSFENNASTEVGSLDESGNLQIDGDLTVSGSGTTSIGGTLSCADLDITGSANALTINSTTGNVAINASSTDADCMVRVSDNSTAGTNAIGMVGTGDDLVMRNDEGNFKVKMANNATTTLDLDQNGNLDITGNILPGITEVKILPRDFIPDDGGRPAMIDDTGSDRWLKSHSTAKLYANVEIPLGFKATHVHIYGSGTSAMTVYEADVNSKTVTSKGTGNIGTNLNITDVTADSKNYILIELSQTSSEEVYGGIMTIAKV